MEAQPLVDAPATKRSQEQIFGDLYLKVKAETSGVDSIDLMSYAYNACAKEGDQSELLLTIEASIYSEYSIDFIMDIYAILEGNGVPNISALLTEDALDAASRIQEAKGCHPDELMDELSIRGAETRSLIRFALKSPNYAQITRVIEDRKTANVETLRGILKESADLFPSLSNGVL